MNKLGRSQFIRKHSPVVERLNDIMAERGKFVQYNMLSPTGLKPFKTYMYNAKCGDLETYGCGSSVDEAIEDAATKFLDKLSYTSRKNDDHLVNSMNSLRLESQVIVEPNNYIGTLQEYCQAHRLDIPKYEYRQENDIKNKRIMYSVICSTGPYRFTGVGISKQIAKNYAARLTYNQINSDYATTNSTSKSNSRKKKLIDFNQCLSINEANNDAISLALDQIYHGRNKFEIPINYIGQLQEICAARGWKLPTYEFYQEHFNEINMLYYSVICSAGSHKSKGVGSSKQIAKNQAAQFVCNQISLDLQKTSILHSDYARDNSNQSNMTMTNLRNVDPCEYIYQIKLWCNELSSSKKECMQKLKRCHSLGFLDIDMSPFEFLTKLANQENLSVKYERLSNNINGAQVFGVIYLQLPTKHGMTNIGNGKTDAEAQNVIAKNILAFIKYTISKV